ncbi:MAG TPA: FG-GAP-like repeat-containing protein [Kiritimatiellia bacterium]|nr:FG-GAP-like repeat-containing protein [Kiritimatiellia bacterium]
MKTSLCAVVAVMALAGPSWADSVVPWSLSSAVTGEVAGVRLGHPDPAELTAEASMAKGSRRIGYFRALPKPLRSREAAGGSTATWSRLPDGRRLLVWVVESPLATGIRAELLFRQLPAGAQVIAYDPDRPDKVSGPYDAQAIDADGRLWTETVFAERVVIELLLPARAAPGDLDVRLERIVHVYDFPNPLAAKAGSCHGDPNCYTEWSETAKAIAAIASITDVGFIFCTGTLVTDGAPLSFRNDYFLTANHCVGTPGEASNLEFYWFYNTPFCNGTPPNPRDVPRTGGGADYLVGATYSQLSDFTFLRLRQRPPTNTTRAAWSSTPVNAGEPVAVIHHPDGSHKRISFGNINTANANYWKVRWTTGATEGGSSGSPLFNSAKRIIGQLYGGYSSCSFRTGLDDFGRFDQSFPRIEAWLNPPLRDRYVLPGKRDYNGDGKADLDLFWPEGGMWYMSDGTNTLASRQWGWSETQQVPADYDGDGLTDVAVFHAASGTWYIFQSQNSRLRQVQWGWADTIPVPADYDGDGKADIAVYHPPTGGWYIWQSGKNQPRQAQWGWNQTLPVPGDYDGDGKVDIAVFFPPEGRWYIWQSGLNQPRYAQWGWNEVMPVPADYDGDGKTDIAVFHRPTARWFIAQSNGPQRQATWGWGETMAVPADYDGDGKADIAVYWPREGRWYIASSLQGKSVQYQFGWSRAWPASPAR